MSDARALGRSGEEAAVAYLRKKKFKVVCRGFRFHKGEIDIVAYERISSSLSRSKPGEVPISAGLRNPLRPSNNAKSGSWLKPT